MDVKQIAKLTGHKGSIYTIVQGSEPQKILSGAGDGWVIEWDLTNPEIAKVVAKVETNIFSMVYLKSKNWLAVGNMFGGLHWVDLNKKTDLKNIAFHEKGIFDIIEIDDHIYTVGGDGKLAKWNIETQEVVESIQLTNKSLRSIDYDDLGKRFVIGASDYSIYFLDINLNIKHKIESAHENSIFTTKFVNKGTTLFSGSRDAHLKVWDLNENFKNIKSQPAHLFTINNIAFHPTEPIFATASRDKMIKIWDLNNYKLLKVIDVIKFGGHINSVNKLLWSTFNNLLISVSDDRTVIVWKIS
ncbi:MAG: WD40 repeat protein [Cognaticolwellia sp.]|jgi:WD40 repeat protein|tara:strand:+ start:520 stop:1419 length:900 start_codon:yes stop_codon:yes gene_type:complete